MMPLLCALSFVCCSNGDDDGSSGGGKKPAMSLVIESSDGESVTLGIKWLNATHVRMVCMATEDKKALTGAEVAAQGTKYAEERVTIGGLTPMTTYTVFAVACDDAGGYSGMQVVQFVTEYAGPRPYEWESARDGIPSYTDLVLCYGGSTHRTPFGWDKERFAPFVTYTDEAGGEHWLFDSFLCIEFVMVPYSINLGQKRTSGGREQWQELIDYWFGPDNGVNALEEAVGEAAARLGEPAGKRKVVMVMPDPIIYEEYADTNTSTTYWGELNGRAMDFSKEEDQLAVTKWYIDELVKRFKAAKYRNLELSGFYWVAETNNYCGQLTVPISEYIHSLGKLFYWIPYWQSKGAEDWKALGFDVAYQQPNHFFNHSIPDSRLDDACAFARKHGMAMEFEFDEKASADRPNTSYDRMVAYIDRFEKNDVFNSSAIAYYCGNRGVLTLDESKNPKDKAVMDRLARLIRMRRYMKHGLPFKCRTQVVAHRGYWRTEGSDQNSVASLLKADELGVWGVEFDVWRAADGVLVLNHDGVHDGHNVQTTPSTTLTTLRLANGETMPTLAEYLEAAKKTRVHLVLELKPHATPEAETAAAEAAVKMVNDNRLAKRVTYITFSRHAMEELIRLAPKNDVLYLGGDISPEELEAMGAAGGDYNHGVYLRNPSWLAYMKEHKMVSNVWTVNHPVDMIWAIEQQIDFLTTDRPDLFLELVR